MTARRIQTYEECLKSFAREFKKQVKEDLKEAAGVPLIDLGLVDYEVPELKDYTK